MFVLKKMIAPLLMPVVLIAGIFICGVLLLHRYRLQKAGKIVIIIRLAALLLTRQSLVANYLLQKLENDYPQLTDLSDFSEVKWVVVLGGGQSSSTHLLPTAQLSNASIARLVEGIRIHRMIHGSKLLLSGGIVYDPKPKAETMAEVATSIGVPASHIVLETESKDTKDQAMRVKEIIGANRFILVTSAAHMPRAMALFQGAGMVPVPAPIDFWVKETSNRDWRRFFPSTQALRKMQRGLHEYIGIGWAKIRLQT